VDVSREEFDECLSQIRKILEQKEFDVSQLEKELNFEYFDKRNAGGLNYKEWGMVVGVLEEKYGECAMQMVVKELTRTDNRQQSDKRSIRDSLLIQPNSFNLGTRGLATKSGRPSIVDGGVRRISANPCAATIFASASVSAACSTQARRVTNAEIGTAGSLEYLGRLNSLKKLSREEFEIEEAQFSPLRHVMHRNRKLDLSVVKSVLEGTKVDFSLPLGRALPTPLFFAVSMQNANLVELLLEFKADPTITYAGEKMWQGIKIGMTPLEAASSRKQHFVGTVFEAKFRKIENIIDQALQQFTHKSTATASISSTKTDSESEKDNKIDYFNKKCNHFEGSPVEKFILKEKIGEGSFGSVRTCICKETKQLFAMKTLPKIVDAWDEIDILRSVNHKNIISLHATFEDQHSVYLIQEICQGGPLLDAMLRDDCLDENVAKKFFEQALSATAYLHELNICHRDIKPDNMLLTHMELKDAQLKVIDFGTSRRFDPAEATMLTKICTLHYVAPEILTKKPVPYTEKCDVWSLGVTLYLILCGEPPFYDDVEVEQMKLIKKGEFSLEGDIWAEISDSAKDMVKSLLTRKATKRPSAAACLEHEWFKLGQKEGLMSPRLRPVSIRRQTKFLKMRGFCAENLLKRTALRLITSQVADAEFCSKLQEAFLGLDTEDTGYLTLSETEMALRRLVSGLKEDPECNMVQVEMHFQECLQLLYEMKCRTSDHRDLDSKINWRDFFQSMIDRKQVLYETATRAAFDYFDSDGNGVLSREELRVALCEDSLGGLLTRGMDLDLDNVECFLDLYDVDGSGEVDFGEFQAMMMELMETAQQFDGDDEF